MKPWLSLAIVATLAATACAEEGPAPAGVATGARSETILQRDAAGRVRVRREVRLNAEGDYVNHGAWRSWDVEGQLIGQGRYAWGEPTGAWCRWADTEDSPLLATQPFAGFTGPFLSQAGYRDGKLEGAWSIFDAEARLVSQIDFRQGQRHGEAVLYTPEGQVFRRSRFAEGQPVGEVELQDAAGGLRAVASYEAGRQLIQRVEHHPSGALKSRESWLGPLTRSVSPDDPWRLALARYEATGEELRHGVREAWWPNRQPKLRAEYERGVATGSARWWHPNGQLALEGKYENGLAEGDWSWWRENGLRAAACRYAAGEPAGDWTQWTADGRRVDSAHSVARRPSEGLIR
ncbi:MORN repeat variant [Planctomycetes bacterium MalM25]|nr:MORN repeat variant [Planctomycetes bacterium MalM25]